MQQLLGECRMFRLGRHCEITYAEYFGDEYTIVHISYILLVLIALIITIPRTVRLWRVKSFAMDSVQNRLHVYMVIGMSSLIVRCVDPFNWGDRLPFWLSLLAYDVGGTLIICTGLEIVFDWLRVVQLAKGNLDIVNKFRLTCIGLQIFTAFSTLSCGLLTSLLGPIWMWHLIKVAVMAVISITTVVFFVRYGLKVQSIIVQTEQLRQINSNPSSPLIAPLPSNSTQLDMVSGFNVPLMPPAPPVSRKVPKLMIFIVCIFGMSVGVWIHIIVKEAVHRATWTHPMPPPQSSWAMLAASTFDLVHILGFTAISLFFGTVSPAQPAPTSSMSGPLSLPRTSLFVPFPKSTSFAPSMYDYRPSRSMFPNSTAHLTHPLMNPSQSLSLNHSLNTSSHSSSGGGGNTHAQSLDTSSIDHLASPHMHMQGVSVSNNMKMPSPSSTPHRPQHSGANQALAYSHLSGHSVTSRSHRTHSQHSYVPPPLAHTHTPQSYGQTHGMVTTIAHSQHALSFIPQPIAVSHTLRGSLDRTSSFSLQQQQLLLLQQQQQHQLLMQRQESPSVVMPPAQQSHNNKQNTTGKPMARTAGSVCDSDETAAAVAALLNHVDRGM